MNRTINDNGNITTTGMNSLVTNGLPSTQQPEQTEAEMGLVSDDGRDENKPVTSWLFTIITALGLLTFLFVSFYRYHRRLRKKRDREEEYIKKFKELLPDCDYNDFKVTRARSVMTNTHYPLVPTMDKLDFEDIPRIGGQVFRGFTRPKTSLDFERTHADIHVQPVTRFPYPANVTIGNVESHEGAEERSDVHDISYIDEYPDNSIVEEADKVDSNIIQKKTALKVLYKPPFKDKKRRKKQKRSPKSQRSRIVFLNPGEDFVKVHNHQSSYLSGLLHYNQGHDSDRDTPTDIQRSTESVSNPYGAVEDSMTEDGIIANQNDYYVDVGIPKPKVYAQRKRRVSSTSTSADSMTVSTKPNAFYDRLTLRENAKTDYKELVHRDSTGNVNFHARSLPCLDTVYHDSEKGDNHLEKTSSQPLYQTTKF